MVVDPSRKADHARRLELHRLQSERLILEQDYRKKSRALESISLELRRLRKTADRIKTEMRVKTEEEGRLKRDVGFMEADLRRLKKKINQMA
jgi:chromosome segregation ATPase